MAYRWRVRFSKQDVAALAVGVVGQVVEEGDRAQALFVFGPEVEVVLVRVVFDELLQRAGAVGAVFAQGCRGRETSPGIRSSR
jgi:hypothetical protein